MSGLVCSPLQFRALSDQLYYKESRHVEVRQAVVDQLCCFPERYRDYVTTDYKEYVRWGNTAVSSSSSSSLCQQ